MQPPVDNSSRAKAVIVLFRAYLFLVVASIPAAMVYIAAANHKIRMSRKQADSIVHTLDTWSTIVFILLAIAFIMWFRRAYHNLHRIGVKELRHSEGWAAGGWFVPILNLFTPLVIMREIWTKTQEFVCKEGEKIKSGSILGWWWALYIVGNIFTMIRSQIEVRSGGDGDMHEIALAFGTLGNIVDVICILLIIRIIRILSRFEYRLFNYNWKE